MPTNSAICDSALMRVHIGSDHAGFDLKKFLVAALAYDLDTAKLGRQHNDANVIGIGARMHTEEEALELVRMFLATPFSGNERHARRIRLLAEYESRRG